MIRIKGIQQETIEIQIEEKDLIEKVVKMVLSNANLNEDHYIEGGVLMKWDEHYHGSVSSSKIGIASPNQADALDVVKYLRRMYK